MLNDVGLLKNFGPMTVWARPSNLFLNIQKSSTHIHHVTGIVRKSKKRTITLHIIVEILLNGMGTLGIISVFPMIYMQSLWYT